MEPTHLTFNKMFFTLETQLCSPECVFISIIKHNCVSATICKLVDSCFNILSGLWMFDFNITPTLYAESRNIMFVCLCKPNKHQHDYSNLISICAELTTSIFARANLDSSFNVIIQNIKMLISIFHRYL